MNYVLAIAILSIWLLYKFWPFISGKLSGIWSSLPKLPSITAATPGDTITAEQAIQAELLLQRFKSQDNSKEPGAALVIAGLKTLAEQTP